MQKLVLTCMLILIPKSERRITKDDCTPYYLDGSLFQIAVYEAIGQVIYLIKDENKAMRSKV